MDHKKFSKTTTHRQQPSLALAMCIRNEENFLDANLTYHHALGVSRGYIFLDRCTDSSLEIVKKHAWATPVQWDRQSEEKYMSQYQLRCLTAAMEMAREDGCDWLMHVDADEFACGDDRPELLRLGLRMLGLNKLEQARSKGSLTSMLEKTDPKTQMIIMKPKDVIPYNLPTSDRFWDLHYFQLRGVLERSMLNPMTGKIKNFKNRIGNFHGKSIVRTSKAVKPISAHRWKSTRNGEKFKTEIKGFHYHFTVVNGRQWLEKYRKFAEYPDQWEKGNSVRFPKQAWKEASLEMSYEEADEYFREWIAVNPKQLIWPRLKIEIVYEDFVERVLKEVGFDNAT